MASLQEFYKDTATRDNVKAYLQDFLEKRALEKVFGREEVAGVAEAKETIDAAFDNLAEIFEPKAEPTSTSPR